MEGKLIILLYVAAIAVAFLEEGVVITLHMIQPCHLLFLGGKENTSMSKTGGRNPSQCEETVASQPSQETKTWVMVTLNLSATTRR